jgi:hypothetical protein
MTTQLRKPLTRVLVLDEVSFKVVLSPEGVSIMRKGRRKAPIVSWETILRLSQDSGAESPPRPAATASALPSSIATDIAKEIVAARAALTLAAEKLGAAKDLPPELRREIDPDPVCGQREQRSDWFVEPLLTATEVASVLRVSTAAVARLPIRWILIAGERRYRQSEIRKYLEREEREGSSRW